MKVTIENKNAKMTKICKFCKNEIPAGRLKALPTAVTCVECSTAGMKRGVPVQLGSGDHTCTELLIMEEDTKCFGISKHGLIESISIQTLFLRSLDVTPIL